MEWTNFDVMPVIQGGAEDESGITDIVLTGACPDPGGKISCARVICMLAMSRCYYFVVRVYRLDFQRSGVGQTRDTACHPRARDTDLFSMSARPLFSVSREAGHLCHHLGRRIYHQERLEDVSDESVRRYVSSKIIFSPPCSNLADNHHIDVGRQKQTGV
jgi:hypothetical protein